jgi:hypothetical protein
MNIDEREPFTSAVWAISAGAACATPVVSLFVFET